MRVILTVTFPLEPFNTAVRNGTAGETLNRILEEAKPESAYFTEMNGNRGAILVINIERASQLPAFAEPWFLSFNANCQFRIAMSPDDLAQAGLDELGKKWA
ncbi:MAG TPA: panthothenate synthetase [Blastocatellia bacterium]|nr:panthothenate synthetase [Blastocatellia bacterium]